MTSQNTSYFLTKHSQSAIQKFIAYIALRCYSNVVAKTVKKGSNIAKHAWDYDHKIDFENGKLIDSGNYRTRKTLESWHTATITNSDNYCKPLPKQYATLVRKICNR